MGKKPNIIIFNPDQMRADSLHHLGNAASITPNLDSFAERDAVSFRNAFCQNPVCVPSRCSFFTGLYPHVRGHRTMSYLLRPGEDSLLKTLKEAGYYVWANDRNDLIAGQKSEWAKSHVNEYFYSLNANPPGLENPSIRGVEGDKNYYSHYFGKLKTDKNGLNYTRDDEAIDGAIECIKKHKDDPLCIFLGLMLPHVPYKIEDPYFSAINRSKLKKRIDNSECFGKSKILDEIRQRVGMNEYTEADWDELRAVYLGMCMKIDTQFGRLLQILKDERIYDDTAIFFLSDHGDFTGDYGLPEKCQNSFEDCLTNVPLLIKPPKGYDVSPGVSDSMTELIDFYATVLDITGIKSPHTHFGKSLVPVLKNRSEKNREFVFCEGGRQPEEIHCDVFHKFGPNGPSKTISEWPKMAAMVDNEAHAKGIMIRNKNYKYISRTLGRDELYDLNSDPNETTNIIDNPEYEHILNMLRYEMLKWLEATDDIVPFERDSRFTNEMLWARIKSNVPEGYEAEIKKMIEDGVGIEVLAPYCRSLKNN